MVQVRSEHGPHGQRGPLPSAVQAAFRQGDPHLCGGQVKRLQGSAVSRVGSHTLRWGRQPGARPAALLRGGRLGYESKCRESRALEPRRARGPTQRADWLGCRPGHPCQE